MAFIRFSRGFLLAIVILHILGAADMHGFESAHMLAVYRLAVGSFSEEQLRKIEAVLDDGTPEGMPVAVRP